MRHVIGLGGKGGGVGFHYLALVGELKSRHFEEVSAVRHHDVVGVIHKGVGALCCKSLG